MNGLKAITPSRNRRGWPDNRAEPGRVAGKPWPPLVWARRPDFVRDDSFLWEKSKVRQFAAVELDIAQGSLR